MSDKSPPWVLFTDKGKPVAILPAMRPGEVANVEHLTMRQAQAIVRAANRLADLIYEAHLDAIMRELESIGEEIAINNAKAKALP